MFDLAEYSAVVRSILEPVEGGTRSMPLAPQSEFASESLSLLRRTAASELFDDAHPASPEFANCVRSALFLYFSALDESHTISQGVRSATGSYLHGIMHRQEPDYSNARYWFQRVGRHDLFPTLKEECSQLQLRSSQLIRDIEAKTEWDPFWMVDQCEMSVAGRGPKDVAHDLESIQNLEWRLVFDYSYRRALSG